jgi:hypothetical protein
MKFKPFVFNADLDLVDPRLILLRSYTYLYKLSNYDEIVTHMIFSKLKRLKCLRKIKIDTSINDYQPEVRWLKTLYKTLNFFSSLHLRAIVPLGKKLSSLKCGPFMADFRTAYTLGNYRAIKTVAATAKKMILDMTDCVEEESKIIPHLSKIFKRSKVDFLYFHASRFDALELTMLTQQICKKPPKMLKIELSSERVVYERLHPLQQFSKGLEINLMMDFGKFKFGMTELEQNLRKLVLVINLGADVNALTKLKVLDRMKSLVDSSLIIQFTWSNATFSDVLDTLRFSSSIVKMKLILVGSREPECSAIEEADQENYLEVLKAEKKHIRRFFDHVGTLTKLKALGFHFRIYGPLTKFYQHFISAACHSAPQSLKKFKVSVDKDDSYRGKPCPLYIQKANKLSLLKEPCHVRLQFRRRQ